MAHACVFVCCAQVEVPHDYHHDQEFAVFHAVIAMEACMRKCKEKEVRCCVTLMSECIVLYHLHVRVHVYDNVSDIHVHVHVYVNIHTWKICV